MISPDPLLIEHWLSWIFSDLLTCFYATWKTGVGSFLRKGRMGSLRDLGGRNVSVARKCGCEISKNLLKGCCCFVGWEGWLWIIEAKRFTNTGNHKKRKLFRFLQSQNSHPQKKIDRNICATLLEFPVFLIIVKMDRQTRDRCAWATTKGHHQHCQTSGKRAQETTSTTYLNL